MPQTEALPSIDVAQRIAREMNRNILAITCRRRGGWHVAPGRRNAV